MSEPLQRYQVRTSGLWNTRHRFFLDGEEIGVLRVKRGKWMVVEGEFRPVKGEVLTFRRDPGLLRGQFSLWTDGREWLGSSLRPQIVKREIGLSTGTKPLRLLPVAGWRCGWSLYAPKSGENARFRANPLTRRATVEVYRRLDLPVMLFAYFLGRQVLLESLAPGPRPEKVKAAAAATAV